MPIPGFTIDGILPPFVGPNGPGGAPEDLSPYAVTAIEVVTTLALTDDRKKILRLWLRHRAALRAAGFDLDVVTFIYRPAGVQDSGDLARLLRANLGLFGRAQVKAAYHLDFFAIDLDGSAEAIVSLTRYWLGVFSHRRVDYLWKGMLQVRLEDVADDAAALAALGPDPPAAVAVGGTNP